MRDLLETAVARRVAVVIVVGLEVVDIDHQYAGGGLMTHRESPVLVGLIVERPAVENLGKTVELAEGFQLRIQLVELVAHLGNPGHGPDLGLDDHGADRFDQIVVATGLNPFAIAFVLVLPGHEDDRHPVSAEPLPDQARGFKAVQAGHLHIHDDQIDRRVFQQLQRLFSAAGNEWRVACLADVLGHGVAQGGAVFDQQNLHELTTISLVIVEWTFMILCPGNKFTGLRLQGRSPSVGISIWITARNWLFRGVFGMLCDHFPRSRSGPDLT